MFVTVEREKENKNKTQNMKEEDTKKNVRKKWHLKGSLLLKRCFD